MASTISRRSREGSRQRPAGWTNWAGDQSCAPAEILRPRSRDGLAEAVAAAAAAGRTISISGSGHSFTEAAMTDGSMIRVESLAGVIEADRASGLVRVGAGTVLADLNLALARLGLAMENLGDIDRQTIAGAISTATHGTGAGLRNISAQVEAMELVLGDGSVRELTAEGEPRVAEGGTGGARGAGRDLGGDPALRSRLHPAPDRQAPSPRRGPRLLRRAGRRERPFRVLRLPPHRHGADDPP